MQKTNADSRGGLHIPMPRYSETSAADQAVTNAMLKALRTVRSATSPAPASPTELERQRRGQKRDDRDHVGAQKPQDGRHHGAASRACGQRKV